MSDIRFNDEAETKMALAKAFEQSKEFMKFRPDQRFKFKEGEEYQIKQSQVKIEMGRMVKVMVYHTTQEEENTVLKYCIVLSLCLEGKQLDYKKAKEKLGIKEIMKKYGVK